MPPLGADAKKSRVSEQILAWGYFSLELGYAQVAANIKFKQPKKPIPVMSEFSLVNEMKVNPGVTSSIDLAG